MGEFPTVIYIVLFYSNYLFKMFYVNYSIKEKIENTFVYAVKQFEKINLKLV